MANTRSAAKQARAGLRKRAVNQRIISGYKTVEKKILALVKDGKKEEATKLLSQLQSAVDKAAKKKSIHSNKAARIKARLAASVK